MKKYVIKILCALAICVLIVVGVFIWDGLFAKPSHLHRLKAEEVAQAGMYTMDKKYVACTLGEEDIAAIIGALNEGSFKRDLKKRDDKAHGTWSAPFFFQMQDHSVLKITLEADFLMIGEERYRCDDATRAKLMEYFEKYEEYLTRK